MTEENIVEQPVCRACQIKASDSAYAYPLCQSCRETLINRPFPKWIKFVMLIVSALLLYSAFNFPIAFKAGLAKQSAKKAEAMGDYSSAITEYKKILALFPDSEEHKARLAVCYLRNGEIQQATDILKKIDDKKLSQNLVKELNALIEGLKQNNSN